MKTKFLRKLSFVLVVAMVLSLFVPAAGAFAAAKPKPKPKLNSTNKYLHLGVAKKDEFNFNIANKQKGWKYYWESADEDVAEVNEKNGVTTAVGVGKTKITCEITDADGEEVAVLEATVTVRDNIEEVKISNPVEGTLAVGKPHDFNRSFVTVSGSTKKTSAITRWSVEPADGATIDDKGVFVATEAGEFIVAARSFQSKAKYKDWLGDPEKYADYVLDIDITEVTVAGSMVEAKQVDLKTVDVTFDTAMEDVDKNIAVYQVVGSAKVKQVIEKVTMSEDKKVATVKVYVPFAGGATYVVEYTDLDPLTFEAATSKVEDVASLEITTTTAVVNEDTPVKFKLLNAAGVNITTTELANRVTMKSSGGVGTYFNASKNEVKIFQKDASTTITATFHTYKYDSTGKEAVVENAGLIVGVPADATNIAGLNAWTIVNDGNPKFDDVKQTIAVGDIAHRLYVEFNTKTGSKDGKVNSKDTPAKFDFTSSDKNILIIDQLGNLYPAKDGVVTVVVSYGDAGSRTVVGAIPVTVGAKRVATSLSLSSTDISLSNAAIGDEAEVEVKVKDQYGADFAYGTYKVEKLDGSPSTGRTDVTAVGSGSGKIKFQGEGREVGTYYYRVTVGDMIGIITVTILDGSGETVSYRLQLSASTVDLKAEAGKTDKSVKVELFGYNAKGVKSSKAVLDGVNYKVSIKAPKSEHDYTSATTGTAITGTAINYTLANAVSGGAINKLPVGTYEVTAEVKIEGVFVTQDVQYFTVTDSQPVPVIAEVKNRLYTKAISASALNLQGTAESSDADLIAAVKETIKFTLNGSEITTIQSVKASGFPSEVSISSVTIRQYIGNSYIDHKVAVGLTILKK